MINGSIMDSAKKCYKKHTVSKQQVVKRTKTWNEWFAILSDFRRQHGHCNVPYNAEHRSLSRWLQRQKRRVDGPYDGGKQLTLSQVQKLQSVGAVASCDDARRSPKASPSQPEVADRTSPNSVEHKVASPRRMESPERMASTVPSPKSKRATAFDDCPFEDTYFCKVRSIDLDGRVMELGFLCLPISSSFADARKGIVDAEIMLDNNWVFKLPRLGPITNKQEVTFGSLLNVLKRADHESIASDGVAKVFVTKITV